MKIYNSLPTLISCLNRWKTRPTPEQFEREYSQPLAPETGNFFDDFYDVLSELDWSQYREHALKLDPQFEEQRLIANLAKVEAFFGFKLEGEICLTGTFETMDGFARFERGRHRVYLGVDESHLKGQYLDVLTVHELTHVARESRPEVWQGFGLDPKMSRRDFLEFQPVVEHVFGEGFSCLVSEILVPGEDTWTYAYQTRESLQHVYARSKQLDQAIQREIQDPNGDYGRLYGLRPHFAHYVWGWKWATQLLRERFQGDARQMVKTCSKEWIDEALTFSLRG